MNLRPPGYEPDELPTALPRVNNKNTLPKNLKINGGGNRIRTCEGVANGFTVRPLWPARASLHIVRKIGADDGTRTRNLLITSQLLFQLSYVGFFLTKIIL